MESVIISHLNLNSTVLIWKDISFIARNQNIYSNGVKFYKRIIDMEESFLMPRIIENVIMNDNIEGVKLIYYLDSSGSITHYMGNMKNGPYISWGGNGFIKEIGNYLDNEKSGAWYGWHLNGSPWYTITYVKGKPHKEFRRYNLGGVLSERVLYDLGKPKKISTGRIYKRH